LGIHSQNERRSDAAIPSVDDLLTPTPSVSIAAHMTDREIVFPLAGKRIWVAGHHGMVGSALVRRLERERCEILTVDRSALDLRRQRDVEAWLDANRPDVVINAAATVGGILANASRPADFLYDNLAIATNVIHGAHRFKVSKLLFLGAACVYPRLASQPMREDALLAGPPEPTNEWYTVAKIAGIKLCQAYRRQYGSDFISVVPANLYGPGDRFDETSGHVVPGLIMRAHAAIAAGKSELSIWGTGRALREFMHVDDGADALIWLLARYSSDQLINVGTGQETSIGELARKIAAIVGFSGRIAFDTSKPDGMPRKLLDSSRILAMGWQPSVDIDRGLADTCRWYFQRSGAGTERAVTRASR
jgi:GDP-L-fucose synthase